MRDYPDHVMAERGRGYGHGFETFIDRDAMGPQPGEIISDLESRNPSSSPPSGLSFGLTMMRKRSEESEDLIPVPLPIGIRCSELVWLRS